jgi:hypothetical protein
MKKHDQVCSRASHPATGYVVRAGADWVDVEWHAGIRCTYRERMRRGDVLLISTVLARAVDSANDSSEGGEV